jgi:DtxR family transcriptional regulator, Mn-dependent transcriptional regulator
MLSQSIQDYLKSIHKLQEDGPVSTTDLAHELNISGASVTGMLKRLDTMGFVNYNSYKGVTLTDSGNRIALEIIRHHRLLELYLKEVMGYSLEKVHDEACRLEHHISEEFGDKISDMLGNPKFDPHGHPIPTKDGRVEAEKEIQLCDGIDGNKYVISRLDDENPSLLGYLEKMRLLPGIELLMIDKAPFSGPIKLNRENEEIVIGHEIAKSIFIK